MGLSGSKILHVLFTMIRLIVDLARFFVYASCYWLEHLANVPTKSVPRLLARIEDLCQAGSTRLHNWTQQNCRPGCTMTPRVEFDSDYMILLESLRSMAEVMLRDMLDNSSFNGTSSFKRQPWQLLIRSCSGATYRGSICFS